MQHDDHVDEKWLVSYADMMTLLFGLFVILFSISMENQATFQDNLKKLSDSTTRNPANEEKKIVTANRDWERELAAEREKAAEAERQLQAMMAEMTAAREKPKNIEQLQNKIAELERMMSNSSQSQSLLAQKSKELEKALAEKAKMAEEMARLEEQLRKAKELELKVVMLEDEVRKTRELQAQITVLEDELRKAKEHQTKNEQLEDKLNKAKELENRTAALAKENKSSERAINSLQANDLKNQNLLDKQKEEIRTLSKLLEEAKNEVKKLNDELKLSERKNGDNQSYLFVILKWSTEKHDLDLTVTDPAGKEFNFKKKSFEGAPGLFSLDSRSGPGAEIWQSSNPIPGTYTIRLKMYNNYGNNEQAVVSGSIMSNKSSIVIDNKKLESKSGATITLKVTIDEKGVAKLQ